MKKHTRVAVYALTIGAIGAWTGVGTAAAMPDVVGKRFWEARAALGEANLTPVVATVVGDRVPQDECFVVSVSQSSFRDQSGASNAGEVLVNLSCYAKPATNKSPGMSAGNNAIDASAVRDTSEQETEAWQESADGQKWCAKAQEDHPDWGHLEWCDTVPAPAQ